MVLLVVGMLVEVYGVVRRKLRNLLYRYGGQSVYHYERRS